MMMRLAALALIAFAGSACAGVGQPQVRSAPPPAGASMWVEPKDIASRDLYYGPWGKEHAPDPHDTYDLVELKHSGVNLGMTVKDSKGREWSVKQPYPGNLDSEGPVEVTLSRLLSAVGYHQPPVYFLPAFTLKDDFGRKVTIGGRFRPKLPEFKEVDAWDWADNPFVGRKEFQGLIVALVMFNSTDMKSSNNSLYERKDGDYVEQWYVARDIGSALGDTQRIAPRKNHIDSFERMPYILGVNDAGFVDFAYNGWYKNLVLNRIKPEDVAWISNLFAQLSDRQMQDAFRAGGFAPDVAARFIAKLREKIQQGRSLSLAATRD
jgi:hypothetical protein